MANFTSSMQLLLKYDTNKSKEALKMYQDEGIVKQTKAGKQGRDDSIKCLSIHSSHIHFIIKHVLCEKICRVGLYTELSYAIIPTFSPAFCSSTIPTFCYIFNDFFSSCQIEHPIILQMKWDRGQL